MRQLRMSSNGKYLEAVEDGCVVEDIHNTVLYIMVRQFNGERFSVGKYRRFETDAIEAFGGKPVPESTVQRYVAD
jgi:hypothetical protein